MYEGNHLCLQNQFDSIDLSDNAIMILEGFPQLPRLKSLYLNNNRIIRVGRNLEGEAVEIHIDCVSSTQKTSVEMSKVLLFDRPKTICENQGIPLNPLSCFMQSLSLH